MGQEFDRVSETIWAPEARIANPPPTLLAKYTGKEKTFFYEYANFVLKIIQDPMVNDRLLQVLATEAVRIEKPVDIRVMVFPARQLRGRTNRVLHGSYSHSASQISLYPLKIPKDWIRKDGLDIFKLGYQTLSERRKRLLQDISATAISTLLHELLHVKFERRGLAPYIEEPLIRKLENQYMRGWEETISAAVQRTSG
jgi:hypothetical protein